jgi:hypothetical protein
MVPDDHGTRSALSHAATKTWSAQTEIVIQNIEQWRRRIDVHGARLAIHLQGDRFHDTSVHSFSGDANCRAAATCGGRLAIKNGGENSNSSRANDP